MKKLKIAAVLTIILAIAGCDDGVIAAKKMNPVITNIGDFDGCNVKYVDRGYTSDSFFMAKCGDTVTQSNTYQSGKTSQRMMTITQKINDLTAERAALVKEEEAKQAALAKLSVQDQTALGIIPPANQPPQ